jgi:hypothetical protein
MTGGCAHPSVGKHSRTKGVCPSVLLVERVEEMGIAVRVGMAFGCVHWQAGPAFEASARKTLTSDELHQVLLRNCLEPIDLAKRFRIRVQRVSDWMSGRRKVPTLAVVAIEAMGL